MMLSCMAFERLESPSAMGCCTHVYYYTPKALGAKTQRRLVVVSLFSNVLFDFNGDRFNLKNPERANTVGTPPIVVMKHV